MKKNKISHWIYNNELLLETPEGKVGFVYCITNIITNQRYVGKKVFISKRTLPPLSGKKRKRRVIKDSDWKTYTSSSTYIKEAIDEYGMDNFKFEILEMFDNRSSMNFAELKLQIFWNVLDEKLENGNRAFYNENIDRVYYNSKNDNILKERIEFDKKYKIIYSSS